MIEESVESFILQYKPYAALVELLPHTEGSPLLECVVGTTVVQMLERTGPYRVESGKKASVIINPTTERLERAEEPVKRLETVALSRVRVSGLVLEREGRSLIVDAGATLVVTQFEPLPDWVAVGEWVQFESLAPVHGFVLPPEPARAPRRREADGDSL